MLVDRPRVLPHQSIREALNQPSLMEPQPAVWIISGRDSAVRAFQTRLASSFSGPGEQKRTSLTTNSSGDGIAGVVNGIQILIQDL